MSQEIKIEKVTEPLYLGEGPHWDAEKQLLYFVNLYKSQIHTYDPKTKAHCYVTLGTKPVTFVIPLADQTDQLIISYEKVLEIITWDGRSDTIKDRRPYLRIIDEKVDSRMNDAKASPRGTLIVGSMGNERNLMIPPKQGNIYRVENCASIPLLTEVGISNGLAWNVSETKFYWCDTLDPKVFVFDWDSQQGTISNQKLLIDYESQNIDGLPDGMTLDSDGFLWIACIKGSQIIQVDPSNGKIMRSINVPCTDVTSVAFGGPNLEDLYCTTSLHNVKSKDVTPEAGCLLKITGLGAKGYPGVPVKLDL